MEKFKILGILLLMAIGMSGCTSAPGPEAAQNLTPTTNATETPEKQLTPTAQATSTSVPTLQPTITAEPTLTHEPGWKADIHLGAAKKIEDMNLLPFEKFDEIFPVIRQMESEYMAGKDISQNETSMSRIELLPGHPFSSFDIDIFDTVGEPKKLEVASMNMFEDVNGRQYFFVGLPHHNRQRKDNRPSGANIQNNGGFIDFTGHYLVDLEAMTKYLVSTGDSEYLLNKRFKLQIVLDAIANNEDRVLETRVFVGGAPANELLIEGQGWEHMAPIISLNEAKVDFTKKIIEHRIKSDTPGAAFDKTFIQEYEKLVIPVAWFSFVH